MTARRSVVPTALFSFVLLRKIIGFRKLATTAKMAENITQKPRLLDQLLTEYQLPPPQRPQGRSLRSLDRGLSTNNSRAYIGEGNNTEKALFRQGTTAKRGWIEIEPSVTIPFGFYRQQVIEDDFPF